MQTFQTKTSKLSGSSYYEVVHKACALYRTIEKQTKRQPYVRSRYFSKDKVFINSFWAHLDSKNNRDSTRRLKFYACGIELLRHTTYEPATKENPNKQHSLLHRFAGITPQKELFFVQVEENKKTGSKYLLSIFPAN